MNYSSRGSEELKW